jgi:hypothetical protein
VLVAGFLAVWGGLTPGDDESELCPPLTETAGYAIDSQLWPPGTLECTVTDGETVATRTTFPWRGYATVVLVAPAVAVFGLRPTRILSSLALLVAAAARFFGLVE